MNVSSEKSTSVWMDTGVADDASALNRSEKADAVVVGSGIAGMSVAYELAKAGKDVVVIDRGPIGKGMTSRTTGHLTAQCDDGFDLLIERRGEDIAKLWYGMLAGSRTLIGHHVLAQTRPGKHVSGLLAHIAQDTRHDSA